jgi:hypothetical protein
MERPAIAATMDIIGITIIIGVLGINTATKGEGFKRTGQNAWISLQISKLVL